MTDHVHARFAQWDGAYVLGALTPADRHAYEEHLEDCARCREALAQLAPMPGLLAQIRPETAADARTAEREAEADVEREVEREAEREAETKAAGADAESSRRRRRILLGGLAAAAVLLLAVTLPPALEERGADQIVTVSPVAASGSSAPMRVEVQLAARDWGTALTIRCDYPSGPTPGAEGNSGYGDGAYGDGIGYGDGVDGSAAPPSYALVVTAADGTLIEVSTWKGVPGEVVTLDASTAVELADITEISVTDPAGAVVLSAEVDAV